MKADAQNASPTADRHHGGDLAAARRAYGDDGGGDDWLDLSTGINPFPYPVGELPEETWARLPDSGVEAELLAAAAAYYGAPDSACVVAASGSQSLIQLLPRMRSPGRVAVLRPTYVEHEPCWAAAGHNVAALGEVAAADCDVVVLANPNNPDGRRFAPAELEEMTGNDRWLVVDEAFADVEPELSLAATVMQPGRIVLRSFGKFFGLAGLRLGFALTAPELAGRIRSALGPWAFSSPAAWIATRAFADQAWITANQERLAAAASELDIMLGRAGLEVIGGTVLYRLIHTPAAAEICQVLERHRILVRHYPERPDWLRFGLPGGHGERLEAALTEWRS
ncbi:MAG: threonine-phosphate decarboxylase CobD [Alphaproteobacteria bacterium]|nr:threonine-phosphate decarboxylase [Rhodospirillaceae bacterium]MDP6403908.1 threonine-phosphate decarboxylase CobD [Alphaproteobacteria bacterium]MDP6623547.1 threonine-phosphate decarboxylase CobD [Alphaproteobacteria bacterium]